MNNHQDKLPNEALDVAARQLSRRDALRLRGGAASLAAARGVVVGLFLFLMLVVSAPTTVAQDAALKQRLDAVIDRALKDERIVGISMVVAQDGKVIYRRTAGLNDREAKKPLPERFRRNAELNEPDHSTFYTPGERGYTDYETLEHAAAE